MKVADIMRKPAVTIPAVASIAAAAAKMRDANVGILAVVDNGDLVGVITDRDIVVRFVAKERASLNSRVADFVSSEVLTCYATDTIEQAAAAMGDRQVRRLPICDEHENLIGVLSVDHIAEDYSEELAGETLGEIVETR